jgi:hypothetical protein
MIPVTVSLKDVAKRNLILAQESFCKFRHEFLPFSIPADKKTAPAFCNKPLDNLCMQNELLIYFVLFYNVSLYLVL